MIPRPSRAAQGARLAIWLLATTFSGSCALDPTVSVYPIFLTPSDERPFASFVNLIEARDYAGAISRSWTIEQKNDPSPRDLAALGHLELVRGRLGEARENLTAALAEATIPEEIAGISWDLSQTEFMADDYARSLIWARRAADHGLRVVPWHIELLEALSGHNEPLQIAGASGKMRMSFGNPAVPRLSVSINGDGPVEAVIDTGAVFTIISESLAETASVQTLGRTGTLRGLLNEPIEIEFGLIESLEIGGLQASNVLVAIMADDALRFFVLNRETFQMEMLLGTNLLRELRIDLDFPAREIELTPVDTRAPRSDQNLFFVDFRPMVQVSINRRGWFLFLLDTGSEVTFLNHSLLDSTAVERREQIHGATLQGLGGSKKRGSQLLDVELATSGWGGHFQTIPTYASPISSAFGILGENFLSRFHVIIDFGKMRLDLLQSGQAAEDLYGKARVN